MRILFTFTIAFLFTILAAGMSSAEMMDHSCPDGTRMVGTMDMANCCCSKTSQALSTNLGNDTLVGDGCCPPATCKGLLFSKEVAFISIVSPDPSVGMIQKTYPGQIIPPVIIGAYRLGVPPPRLFSVPIYIQHCSFLI